MDWGKISPAIFGSLFQSVMDPEQRRNLGAHYTSEKNILKLIKPLFLDELREEFEKIKGNPNKLKEFHKRLSTLRFLDPACGCGNFLVISYRELRLLEIDILRSLLKKGEPLLHVHTQVWIDVDQFYGIEIEEFPSHIAEVALWLIDHQMNMRVSEEFGQYFVRIPLKKSPNIVSGGNALRIDWKEIIPPEKLSYILGNPPYAGARLMDKQQKSEMVDVLSDIEGANNLDYVCAWYYKAALYIQGSDHIKVAFVSTNSITQGEQVEPLWKPLFEKFSIKIHFAHRTFKWSNEAKGNAAVFVVIIGFANFDVKTKTIWDYQTPNSEAHEITAKNINPYLVDADNIFVPSRSKPVCDVPEIVFGSMPNDGGHFLLSDEEKEQLIHDEPSAKKFIRPLISAKEYINGENRWCIWLSGANPTEINQCPSIRNRVNLVRQVREISDREATKKLAETPTLFGEIRQPESDYVLIPRASSENRNYIPIAFFDKNFIVSDTCLSVPNAKLYHFGILTSAMHMAWTK